MLREPYVEQSAGALLDHVALQCFAVRKLRFKPTTIERYDLFAVETTITPYFFINQSTP